jgi:hypothetical protein
MKAPKDSTGGCCPPPPCSTIRGRDGLLGRVWYYSTCVTDFEALENLGFRRNGDICEATVMSGAVAKAEAKGFKVDW